MEKNEQIIKICVLYNPKNLVTPFLEKIQDRYQGQFIYQDFNDLGVGISTLNFISDTNQIELTVIHILGQTFFNKLVPYYYGASGAIIFLTQNPRSFETAKFFYKYFRNITGDPKIPVVFIDVLDEYKRILIEEEEKLDVNSDESYYEMKSDDNNAFDRIFSQFVKNVIDFLENQGLNPD